MEDKDFTEMIRECMLYKDPIGLKKFILEDKFSDQDEFWGLLTLLGQGINESNYNTCLGFYEACERCMRYLVKVGNPKELILALLEEGDSFNDTCRFQTYLQLTQEAILKLPAKQVFSLELALETLNDVIKNLDLPANLDLEGEERRAHDLDPNVENINRFLSVYIDFLHTFVVEACKLQGDKKHTAELNRWKKCLNNTLMKLLDHPLVFLDLTLGTLNEQVIRSNSRLSAEKVVSLLYKLNPSIADFIESSLENNDRINSFCANGDMDNLDDCERVSVLSLACLTYLVYRETVADPRINVLCSAQGLFENNLVFVLELMSRRESEVQAKGVMLLEYLMNQLDATTRLSYDDLDRPEYFGILTAMFDVMIHSSGKDIRKSCVAILPSFINLFDMRGRYQIYVKIFGTVKHSGAYGYCVQLFKNQLEEVLSGPQTDSDSEQSEMFFHLKLKKILFLITNLPDDSATDMIEHSDRLIAVLNFIRYLVLRDPPSQNRSGFWSYISVLDKDFLKPMQVGLDMSKGHYKVELMGLESGKFEKTPGAEMSVSVAGFNLPKMDRDQKMEIMRQALNTLDLMTSLFVRLNELIEMKQREMK